MCEHAQSTNGKISRHLSAVPRTDCCYCCYMIIYCYYYYSIIINYYYYYVTGREQVSVGVVPMMKAAGKGLSGAQSALSVYPIAIANCAEKR